jgi:hypothetical protein
VITASLLDDKTLAHADQVIHYALLVAAAIVAFYLLTRPPNPPRSA